MKKLFAFTILLLYINNYAQESFTGHSFINIKEGIPKVGVSSIVQDHCGFIWIGTTGTGIYKFDGIDYYAYKNDLEDSASLSSNLVQCAFVDSQKRLWFGTENGLNLYDKDLDQFKRISLKSKYKENILDLEDRKSVV